MKYKFPKDIESFFKKCNLDIKIEDLNVYEIENGEIITGVILDNDGVFIQWEKNGDDFDVFGSFIDEGNF